MRQQRRQGSQGSQTFSHVCVDAPQGWESSVTFQMSVTNPQLAIIRLHGRRSATWEARHEDVAERFRYLYAGEQLEAWLVTPSRTIDEARRMHVTFNNKWNYATTNPVEMNAMALANHHAPSIDQARLHELNRSRDKA